ncbi:ABC transporter ATP-binding protein [Agromyces sp. NPDC049794]|uniref:ABC transporter ATP-binding protein n=1 Tax=unclassified Agromyces TaxID=2639701 RepID=UPI0033F58A85
MTINTPLTDNELILDVANVGHTYGNGETAYRAIHDLSFSISTGELVSIVGPSGAGKTTLLRILAGLLTPSQGSVSLLGKKVTGVPEGMAMVFQDYSRSLLPWLRVEKNVLFPLSTETGSKEERQRLSREALHAVGLDGHEHKYPWQLSGGMQQRVAIARALAYRPRLLLMDEPFASVDAQTRSGLEDLVLRIRAEYGMTILFVTHDIDESVYLADRVLVLSKPPATLVEDVHIALPSPRDQISTKEDPEFVHLRGHVARLIRAGGPVPAAIKD